MSKAKVKTPTPKPKPARSPKTAPKTAPKPAQKPRHKPAPPPAAGDVWDLRLYIAGRTLKSMMALANLKKICEASLKGKYKISVIDLLKNPQLAKDDQILALPTLVRMLPKPMKRIIGNLSSIERVLVGFDLRPHP